MATRHNKMNETSAFDILAETYDADFTTSSIGRLQRQRIWSFLYNLLMVKEKPLNILEINCGTGTDAIQMAAMGHRVLATDASAAMIKKAEEKISGAKQHSSIRFEVCSFAELKNNYTAEKFDLVVSNFGGLNCISEEEIKQLAGDLSLLLKPGGRLFLVLMSRFCLWELIYFGFRGRLKTAFRRFNKPVSFRVNGHSVSVYYYTPQRIKKIFYPLFKLVSKQPAGLFIPPTYLEKKFAGKTKWLNRLERLEKRFGYSFLSSFADHYCIIFKKEEIVL